ncbi:hypothetical protein ACOJBO_41785 [Rhizobium beringeri]
MGKSEARAGEVEPGLQTEIRSELDFLSPPLGRVACRPASSMPTSSPTTSSSSATSSPA